MPNDADNPKRDLEEPSSSSFTTPTWPFVLLAVLSFVAMRYFDAYGGGFNNNVYAKNLHMEPLLICPPGRPETPPPWIHGRRIYMNACAACHQADGNGIPTQFPPIAGSDWVNGVGPDRMIRLVLDGISGPITVSGAEFNNAMVPWRQLTDQQIADVISYVRNDWGNEGSYLKADQEKAIRDAQPPRAPWTAAELLELPHGE